MGDSYGVNSGELTPMGLRQRYLLGKYMKTMLSSRTSFDATDIYMQPMSLNTPAALQSMQAELLGYTNGDGFKDK